MWSGIAEIYGLDWIAECWILIHVIEGKRVICRIGDDACPVTHIDVFQPAEIFPDVDLVRAASDFAFGSYGEQGYSIFRWSPVAGIFVF